MYMCMAKIPIDDSWLIFSETEPKRFPWFRVSGRGIAPDNSVVIAKVAQKYDLYPKITGRQRIVWANKDDLPAIWEEVIPVGM